jgi:4-amino-4-deoxy-L-arabinose transferase-like glycosyltransferase
MDGPGTVNARARRWRLALLLAAGLVLFFWRLGSHDLWPPDEPRFALVAKEMWTRGDYAVLSLDDHLYTDKPPLFFWAINGFGRILGGIDEWAARLPSAVATILALFLIERLGAWLYDRRTGLLAALVFATSLQILERGRWASIDMTLNLFVLSAILLLWRGRSRRTGERWLIMFAWIMMGLATLAKGPVGLVLPLLAVLPWALIERDFRFARRVFSPAGIALYLLVTLSWFGLFAHRLGLEYALWVLMHQNVERYVGAWNSTHPVWYYLWRFPIGFFPWIVFFPWGVAHALSREERRRRSAALFLLTWIAAILLFFSFSTGKRGVYIIPLYPAAAILVARLLAAAWGPSPSDEPAGASAGPAAVSPAARRLRAPLYAWAGAAFLLLMGLALGARRLYPDLMTVALGLGLALAAGAVAAAILHARGRTGGAITCLFASLVLVVLVSTEALLPWVNRRGNIRNFAAQVKARLEPAAAFATTEEKRDAWVFYTGRFAEHADTPAEITAYLSRPGPRQLLIEDELLRAIDLPAYPGVGEVLRGTVAGQGYHLLQKDAPR